MSETEDLLSPRHVAVQSLNIPGLLVRDLEADILRLDQIHPVISGNKWFKLKYHIKYAIENRYQTIITFGGAWSNHIIATAFVSRLSRLKSVGVIRGETPARLSQTLLDAREQAMTLEFISRVSYSHKTDENLRAALTEKFGRSYFIPEGGAGMAGIEGSKEILDLVAKERYSHLVCCIGTGTMFTGLAVSALPQQELIGIPVLKGVNFTPEGSTMDQLKQVSLKIMHNYHFGGYAKKTEELIHFMNNFYLQTGVPTDFVYTGKLMYALSDLISKNYFPKNSKILAIHSGGLQGNASLPKGMLLF